MSAAQSIATSIGSIPFAIRAIPACLLLGLMACDLDSMAPHQGTPGPTRSPRLAGVVEIQFERIGSPNMSTSALVAGSVAELEALRAERARAEANGEMLAMDLAVPTNSDGSGNATIQLAPSATESFTHGDTVRYLRATYLVRNAQLTDGAAFDTPRENLTFVAVSTDRTIGQTPVIRFNRTDGSPADPALALDLLPTGAAVVAPVSGAVASEFPDVLQVFEEAEITGLDLPEAVVDMYPYGFIVRRTSDETMRTLDPSPAPDQFDGTITFGYRIPVQPNPADDPSSISLMFLALDDSDARVTQSLEEQTPEGSAEFRDRVENLQDVTAVNLLPGGTSPGLPGIATRSFCSVRTAGTAAAPLAFLVNVDQTFVSFLPDPYAAEGSFVSANTAISATFSQAVEGAGPENFTVRGLQTGPAFRGQVYSGNGTTIIATPNGQFLPGEEIEIVLTRELTCPQARVARLRVATSAGGSTFVTGPVLDVGPQPSSIAVGDVDGDGLSDLVVTNAGDGSATTLVNDGAGTLTPLPSFTVGNMPWSAALADVDDDGAPDLVVANRGDQNVVVLRGNGDGTFGGPEPQAIGGEPFSVAIGDLNGDANPDIVAAVFEPSPGAGILLGNGDGTFSDAQLVSTGGSPEYVAIGDLDRDGAIDLIGTDGNQPRILSLLGNGDGTYVPQSAATVGNSPISIAVGDFNGDGIPDIAVANMNSSFVSVLLGVGDGSFEAQQTFAVGNQSRAVVTGDLNADGFLDLAVTNQAASSISVLRGTGNGDFTLHETVTLPFNPGVMAIGDLNGDGILDLPVANENAGSVTLMLGG